MLLLIFLSDLAYKKKPGAPGFVCGGQANFHFNS